MEFGEERGWMDRTGDRIYDKEEWKKIPTERFQHEALYTLNIITPNMPQEQIEWMYSNLFKIPLYETYNPYSVVLGALALDWKTKKIDKDRFKMSITKYASKLGIKITPMDVLRYARKWEDEWLKEIESRI